jgi:hypothetical protein
MEHQEIMNVIDTMSASERTRALSALHQALALENFVDTIVSGVRRVLRWAGFGRYVRWAGAACSSIRSKA